MAEEETQYQVPEIRSSPYMSPMHQQGTAILLLTNPTNELRKMELFYRGLHEDSDGNLIQVSEPRMNNEGVYSIVGTVQSVVSQVTVMSNIDKKEVPLHMLFLADTLIKDLILNSGNYGITSDAVRDAVLFTATEAAFFTIKRALEEGDKRFWKGSVQELHTSVEQRGKKSGLLSSMNPWKK